LQEKTTLETIDFSWNKSWFADDEACLDLLLAIIAKQTSLAKLTLEYCRLTESQMD